MTTSVAQPSATSSTDSRLSLTLAQRMLLGTHLATLREAKGLTQLEVAREALGFETSHAAVSRLERGVLEEVDSGRLERLAQYFGTTVEALLREISEREEEEPSTEYEPVEHLRVTPTVSKRVAHLRQAAGLTRIEMAVALGYAERCEYLIRDWEEGRVLPQANTLFHMATRFEVSAAWLIAGKRAKPSKPSMPMRMRALQKVYNLSNQELAHLAGLDVATGRSTIARYSQLSLQTRPDPGVVRAVACALDVPTSWLSPPPEGYVNDSAFASASASSATGRSLPGGLSRKAETFLLEMADLFLMGTLSESEIGSMRADLMKRKMQALREAA